MEQNKRIGFIIKLIHDAIGAQGNSRLQQFDVTMSQMHVIHYLHRKEGEAATQKEIEEFFHVTHPTMIGILRRLESKGFISIAVNRQDKRLRDVCITEKGLELHDYVHVLYSDIEQTLLDGFSAEEEAELRGLLEKLYLNIRRD